jgi:hypothetical protein
MGIALAGGLMSDLSIGMLVAFVIYAAFAAFVHELLVVIRRGKRTLFEG